jgi:hypothetical protein
MQRIMGYINSGKQQGAKVHLGGERHGTHQQNHIKIYNFFNFLALFRIFLKSKVSKS